MSGAKRLCLVVSGLIAGCGALPRSGGLLSEPRATMPPTWASPAVSRAVDRYDRGDYADAYLTFQRLGADPASREGQFVRFFSAKALFRMELRSAALAAFEDIARLGPRHRYFVAALPWLAELAGDVPMTAAYIDVLAPYDDEAIAGLEQPGHRAEILYRLGFRAYRAGDLKGAVTRLAAATRAAPRRADVWMLLGATRVRQGSARQASEAFTRAAVLTSGADGEDERQLGRIAILQRARVAYSSGRYASAIELYDRIDPHTPEGATGLLEAAWAHLRGGARPDKALGNVISLRTSFAEAERYPEAWTVEALLHYVRCDDDRAISASRRGRRQLVAAREVVASMSAIDDDVELFERGRALRGTAPPRTEAVGRVRQRFDAHERLAARVLATRAIARGVRWLDVIANDSGRFAALERAFANTPEGSEVAGILEAQARRGRADVGALMRRALIDSDRELRRYLGDASRIEVEALNGKAEALVRGGLRSGPRPPRKPPTRDDEHHIWPDSEKVWRDEVGSIYVPPTQSCARRL